MLIFGALIGLFVSGAMHGDMTNPTSIMQREMLNPVVKLSAEDGTGSGTIIHSGPDGTYVLTNYHVVGSLPQPGRAANKSLPPLVPPPYDAKPPRVFQHIQVEEWVNKDGSIEHIVETGEVVAHDMRLDLALLKISDPTFLSPYTITITAQDPPIVPTEQAFLSGSALGFHPFVTTGLVSLSYVDQSDTEEGRIMVSAPIIYGNSGGAAFVQEGNHYRFIGVPTAVALTNAGAPVPHMAFLIPLGTVRVFLKAGHYEHLIES